MTGGAPAALAVGLAAALAARALHPPPARLGPRVRPYTLAARAGLGRPSATLLAPPGAPVAGGTLGRLFGPPLAALVRRVGRALESRSDEQLALRLRRAGLSTAPDEFRARQVARAAASAAAAGAVAALVLRSPLAVLAAIAGGFLFGASRARVAVERAIEERAARIRHELYTVNQLLAIHVRTGAGPLQAVQRVVARGRGVVVEELGAVLAAARGGTAEAEAFRRAAELTPEPSAARTYHLFATGTERGADLADALLALSEDLRDARREELHQAAVRRRAAMLVPTIAILAPIMLLFIAAPLPAIVLGQR